MLILLRINMTWNNIFFTIVVPINSDFFIQLVKLPFNCYQSRNCQTDWRISFFFISFDWVLCFDCIFCKRKCNYSIDLCDLVILQSLTNCLCPISFSSVLSSFQLNLMANLNVNTMINYAKLVGYVGLDV